MRADGMKCPFDELFCFRARNERARVRLETSAKKISVPKEVGHGFMRLSAGHESGKFFCRPSRELVRYAVRCATFGRGSEVFGLAEVAEESVAFLSSLDLTGPLRAKADQARSHLRRLEDVRYDVAKREP
jgi:hypothetical protein